MTNHRIRVAGIIIENNKLLLIHRKKDGREYWVFPGGGIEAGESEIDAVIREVYEETNIKVVKCQKVFEVTGLDGYLHPYYLCQAKSGKLKLGGPEITKISDVDWYNPEWVKFTKLNETELLPMEAKLKFMKLLNKK